MWGRMVFRHTTAPAAVVVPSLADRHQAFWQRVLLPCQKNSPASPGGRRIDPLGPESPTRSNETSIIPSGCGMAASTCRRVSNAGPVRTVLKPASAESPPRWSIIRRRVWRSTGGIPSAGCHPVRRTSSCHPRSFFPAGRDCPRNDRRGPHGSWRGPGSNENGAAAGRWMDRSSGDRAAQPGRGRAVRSSESRVCLPAG